MRKALFLGLLGLSVQTGFCDSRISAMPSTGTLNNSDIFPVVINPTTNPQNYTISKANLITTLGVGIGSGTVSASAQNQVPRYSVSGSSNVVIGSSNLTNNGTLVTISTVTISSQTIKTWSEVLPNGVILFDNSDGSSYSSIAGSGNSGGNTLSLTAPSGTVEIFGTANLNSYSGNKFLKTDGSSNIATIDLYASTNTWTGGNTLNSSTTFSGAVIFSSPPVTVSAPGNGSIVLTITGSTYSVTSSSIVPIVGNFVTWSSTNGTLVNGGTGTGSNLLPSTNTWTGQELFASPGQSTFTYGLTAGSITVNGSGNGVITLTIGGTNYTAVSSSVTIPTGDLVIWSSSNSTLSDGGPPGGGGVSLGSTNTWTAQQNFNNQMTVSSNIIVNNNGSIGVGQNPPRGSVDAGAGLMAATGYTYDGSSGVLYLTNSTFRGNVNGGNLSVENVGGNVASGIQFKTIGDLVMMPNNTEMARFQASNSSLGIGTSSPGAVLHVVSISTYSFAVSTATNGPYTLDVSSTGHINSQVVKGSTVTSCGTNPVLSGSDFAGTITTAGTVNTCTLTFAKPFTNTPVCTESDNSTAVTADIFSVSPSSVTFGFSASLGTGKIYYICVGSD